VKFHWLGKAAAAATIAGCALSALVLAQDQVIRVNVNLVHVIATVRNRNGELVGSLPKEDFSVYDNGVRQEIKVFDQQSNQPLSVALLVDTSGSTAKDLKFETDSAAKFVRALLSQGNKLDALSLYRFDYDVQQEVGFTHNLDQLERKLKIIRGEAGTSLYDAIFFAARDLEVREGRKVMVIVTDGGNTTSSKDSHQALQAAQLADAVIYPVVVMPVTSDAGRNIGGENALTFMAQGTGGRTFIPQLGAQLDKAFRDIIADLRTEYVLGYYPHGLPEVKDRFHKLEVRLRAPELQVFSRNGYYGDADGFPGAPEAKISLDPQVRKKR
jgi:Ca-activated chloride channel family protein